MPDSPWSPISTHQLTCRHAGLAEGKDLQQCRTQKPTKLTCRRAGLAAGGKVAPSHRPLGMPDSQWNSTAATSGLARTPDSPKFQAALLKADLPACRVAIPATPPTIILRHRLNARIGIAAPDSFEPLLSRGPPKSSCQER